MGRKILVTGGCGYIGSHTVVELQQSGFEVLVIDNLSNASDKVPRQIGKITGTPPWFAQIDMRDREAMQSFFRDHTDLAGVIHFAASKSVGESVSQALAYYHNNLGSLLNLLLCMKDLPGSCLVFSSSCTVYGQPDRLPVTEEAPVKPALSPYGNTKQIAEEIIRDTVPTSHIRGISLRYFNPIGAHQSGLIGELPLGVPDNLLPYITQTAMGKRDKLRVFGKDYDTPDGTCIRDYIHVCDLAGAHVAALQRFLKNRNESDYEVFNLGTGSGHSVLEVVRAFEKVSGMSLPMEFSSRRPGDVEQVWADASLAGIKLGWKAQRGLEEMVSSAWAWEKNLAAGIMD